MEDTAALASELDRLQAMARELGARVDGEGAPAAARELCGALAASVDRAVRLAGTAGNGNAGPAKNNGQLPRNSRKAGSAAKVRTQVRVGSVQDTGPLDDGLSWRKYGQKDILGARYPRAYFRCTHRHTRGCQATKQVQRATGDPLLFDVLYHGAHTCQAPAPSLLLSPEQQQQQPPASGQVEQGWPAAASEGIHQWPVELVTPHQAIDGCSSPASYCYQLDGYTAAGGVGADMEFEAQLEFFLNTSQFFQPQIQSL